MAKEWWENAPLAREKPTEWWKDAPLAEAPSKKKEEEEGFFTGAGKSILSGLKDTGGSLYSAGATGLNEREAVVESAKAAAERSKEGPQALRKFQTDIQKRKESSDEGLLAGIKNVAGATFDNPEGAFQMVVSQLPNTGVALGAGAAGAAAGSLLGPVGTVAGFLTGLFTANTALELGGKAQEKARDGNFSEAERLEAMREGVIKGGTVTAVDAATFGASKWILGTANRAVETATVRAIENAGFDAAKVTSSIKVAQKEALDATADLSERVSREAVEQATARAMAREGLTDPKLIDTIRTAQTTALADVNTIARKAGRGTGALGLQSVGEGLGEYLGELAATGEASPTDAVMEALAGLSMSLGELGGAAKLNKAGELTRASEVARKYPDKSVFDQLRGEQDVGQVIPPAGGAGTGLAGQPGAGSTAGRAAGLKPDGVVLTGQDAADADAGAGQPAGSLGAGSFVDFRDQYEEIRNRIDSLPASMSPAQMDMKVRLVSDLQSLVQQYKPDLSLRLGQREIQVLNSPTSDRVESVLDKVARKVGQPRGMQSNMFGSFERVTQMARDAMAMAGGDVNKAVANLEAAKQRYIAKLQAGGYDENWAISQAGPGLTAGEAVKSRQQLAEQHVARLSEQIDQAIVQLRRPARGMQSGDLFNKETGPNQGDVAWHSQNLLNLTAKFEDARDRVVEEQAKVDDVKQYIANGNTGLQRTLDNLTEQTAWYQEKADKAKAEFEKAKADYDTVKAIWVAAGSPRAMQSSMFDEGPSRDEAVKPIPQNAQTQDMLGESTDPETLARMEATRLSAEIEKRNKGRTQVEGASLTPQERLDLLAAREADLVSQLERTETQKVGSSLGVEEKDLKAGLQSELNAVRRDMQTAQDEIASGKTAPAAQPRKETAAPVKVESTQEQNLLGEDFAPTDIAPDTIPQIVNGKVVYVTAEKTKKAGAKQPRREAPPPMLEDDEEFGMGPVDELYEEEAPVQTVEEEKETIKAPEVDTEQITQTAEGQVIQDFFDSIKSAADSEQEQTRHGESKNVAAKSMLRYDIAKPGETTSPGIKRMLKYLTSRVGGADNFNTLLEAIRDASPIEQSRLFIKASLPDLTARRGMEQFSDDIRSYISQLSGKETGVTIDKSGVYRETITTGEVVTQTFGKTPEGAPRQPTQSVKETEHDLRDRNLYGAVKAIEQAQTMGAKLSKGATAALSYLQNLNRKTFGQALHALAYDLAHYEINQEIKKTNPNHKNLYGSNYGYFGEGGQNAENFRNWIEENLGESTLDTLNDMVAEFKRSEEAHQAYEKANKDFDVADKLHRKMKKAEGSRVATLEKELKKNQKKKTKAEKAENRAGMPDNGEIEVVPEIEDSNKYLPTIESLHPDITRKLEAGDVRGALELFGVLKKRESPYYAELAQRLLDTGFTAKSRMISLNTMEPLSNDPSVVDALKQRTEALRDVIVSLYPKDQQAGLLSDIKSNDLRDVISAIARIEGTMRDYNASPSSIAVVQAHSDLIRKEYAWDGKYDPATDTIVLRQGSGVLTNHLLLHETLHAATSHLLDNPKSLSGVQRTGYDQLKELYEYSKSKLPETTALGVKNYGLQDIHEFVAEALTNPAFQAQLRTLRYKNSPYSLINRFTMAIRKMLRISKGAADSNVLEQTIFATDALMAGTMQIEGMTVVGEPKGLRKARTKPVTTPVGMPNQPGTIAQFMRSPSWTVAKRGWNSVSASSRPALLGIFTLRQIDDLVGGRIPQIKNFIKVTEDFLARKSNILEESAKISRRWELLQSKDPDMSRKLGAVMHSATIIEVDPDVATTAQRNNNVQLMQDWNALTPEAKAIYRDTRDFFDRRYREYKQTARNRINLMRGRGISNYQLTKMIAQVEGVPISVITQMENYQVSEKTINTLLRSGFTKGVQQDLANGGADGKTILEIRQEFERLKTKGPYFPLMRHGRFWYQVGTGAKREYYMFETAGARDAHIEERLKKDPQLASTIGDKIGNDYAKQMDVHARDSQFLKDIFNAVDDMDVAGLTKVQADERKQELKDGFYQTFLQNQPDRSIRNQFIHRNSVEGFSQDALRNFSQASFNIAYQQARFEFSPELFSQLDAARQQVKRRQDAGGTYNPALVKENDELNDYIKEAERRLGAMLNPPDVGRLPSILSNIGFVYYLTSVASAITNILGGMMIGLPTLVGQQVRNNPTMGYTRATAKVISDMTKTMIEIMSTGFGIEKGGRARDYRLLSPSLERNSSMSTMDRAAYNRFVADGLIDITAAYDQSGLASAPTEQYSSLPNKSMQVLSYMFHHAERVNREIMSMSAFRSAMDRRANYKNKQQAFAESIAEAKDVTARSMFDYSSANKPRYFQHPVAGVILQFKQFPQQMTFFLARNAYNAIFNGKLSIEEKREARARFAGTMGTAAIMSGVTGVWGFSTVAAITEAVFNGLGGDEGEEPFDFELEFVNYLVTNLGVNAGMFLARGAGNAIGFDLASKLKLDGMWIPDMRKNLDGEAMLTETIVKALGPTVGLAVNVPRAWKQWNEGHGDKAIETISPAFVKQPMIAYRYAKEGGAKTMAGDYMVKDFTPFELFMQSLGIRSAELAEIQEFNIKKKGQEQGIIKERQQILNLFALSFMSGDAETNKQSFENIMKFNAKHPTKAFDADGLISSIQKRMEKSAQTEYGLSIDPKLQQLVNEDYIRMLARKPKGDKPSSSSPKEWWEDAPLSK
jgi:hypothetical protein